MAVKNQELQQYYSRKATLEKTLSLLEFESSSISSIKALEERAKNMGFVTLAESVSLLDTSGADQFASLNMSSDFNLGR
ncbi:hypothetical protein JXA34_01120 [Patescibacteria group bacterium]|nr:hypothetical protein [Patescibacteria group bacterium]